MNNMKKYGKLENGIVTYFNPFIARILNENNKILLFPSEEILNNHSFYEVIEHNTVGETSFDEDNKVINKYHTFDELKPIYEKKVVIAIRQKYSLDEELAILRQRDTKKDEFNEYFNYCETCKNNVKSELNIQ